MDVFTNEQLQSIVNNQPTLTKEVELKSTTQSIEILNNSAYSLEVVGDTQGTMIVLPQYATKSILANPGQRVQFNVRPYTIQPLPGSIMQQYVSFYESTQPIETGIQPLALMPVFEQPVTGNVNASIDGVVGVDIQNANIPVTGTLDANITNAQIPITGDVSISAGTVDANITNAEIPVSGTVDANITNANLSVTGDVTISSGTVQAEITNAEIPVSGTVTVQAQQALPITNEEGGIIEVGGTIDANIINAEIPVSGNVNATIQNASLPVNGTVSVDRITGTVNANITNATLPVSGSVNISNTPSVAISNTPSVNIASGTVNATIENAEIDSNITNAFISTNELVHLGDVNDVATTTSWGITSGVQDMLIDTIYIYGAIEYQPNGDGGTIISVNVTAGSNVDNIVVNILKTYRPDYSSAYMLVAQLEVPTTIQSVSWQTNEGAAGDGNYFYTVYGALLKETPIGLQSWALNDSSTDTGASNCYTHNWMHYLFIQNQTNTMQEIVYWTIDQTKGATIQIPPYGVYELSGLGNIPEGIWSYTSGTFAVMCG